jgi:hypothetical protein
MWRRDVAPVALVATGEAHRQRVLGAPDRGIAVVRAVMAVQNIVKGLRQPSPAVIAEVAQDHVTETGQAALRELLTLALQQLHEGSIARYRLRRSEYIAWQHAQAQT